MSQRVTEESGEGENVQLGGPEQAAQTRRHLGGVILAPSPSSLVWTMTTASLVSSPVRGTHSLQMCPWINPSRLPMCTGRRPEGPFSPLLPAPFRAGLQAAPPLPLHLRGLAGLLSSRSQPRTALKSPKSPTSVRAVSTRHFIHCSIFQFPPWLLVGT